jgi:hypothetical protein
MRRGLVNGNSKLMRSLKNQNLGLKLEFTHSNDIYFFFTITIRLWMSRIAGRIRK